MKVKGSGLVVSTVASQQESPGFDTQLAFLCGVCMFCLCLRGFLLGNLEEHTVLHQVWLGQCGGALSHSGPGLTFHSNFALSLYNDNKAPVSVADDRVVALREVSVPPSAEATVIIQVGCF